VQDNRVELNNSFRYYSTTQDISSTLGEKEKSNIFKITMWKERWFLSSNAKDIGTLYLMFALFAGLIGTSFSVLIRLELSAPGVQYIADNQLYNSIITAHAILMIFFMVKFNAYMFSKYKSWLVSVSSEINDNNNMIISNNNNDNKEKENNKFKYTKIIVENPYNSRDTILKVTKKQKGVYIWETLDGKNVYVGHSINLYNRISSYFMPSILNTKARRVIRHLNKHGFNDIKLTVYIMDIRSSLKKIVSLEQHFIDTLKPSLNVDLVASSPGYHEPMSQEMRERLRKQRGTPVYVYEAESLTLLHIFNSKQYMYNKIGIHHKSLQDCLDIGNLYLDYFFLSLDLLETDNIKLLTLNEIIASVNLKREFYKVKLPAAKPILAEFKDDASKNLEFSSLNSLAKHLKGDRQVIREYLKKSKSGYYRGKWKFTYQKNNI
jgi:GIY-YIG catalytic domain/Cytochrome C and Quinol oxidase polypeptide I/NUMOD1 domain